jgi:nucleoside-diphosphate-sugar epimerase
MKKLLITGKNSYIGTSVEKWLAKHPNKYQVTTLDMQDPNWQSFNFNAYNSILHVAGIAHADTGKISKDKEKLYYEVNTELPIKVAKKAKEAKVKQFIFMSSIIVYGDVSQNNGIIDETTIPKPLNCYGDSKLQAELQLRELETANFKVATLRPPMIYGSGCKGNYKTLSKIANNIPFFPLYKNKRSMIYIDNFCEFVRLILEDAATGTFYPQNTDYVVTSKLVKSIRKAKGKKTLLLKGLPPIINLIKKINGKIGDLATKAFGDLTYKKELSNYSSNYNVVDFSTSIRNTENKANENSYIN